MKKLSAMVAVLALALALVGALAYAADEAKSANWTGWITDAKCGAKNANAEGKSCALQCYKDGSKLVLYTDGDKKLVGLDNQEEAAKHVGHPVVVTGTLDGDTIKVSTIKEKKG
jgi:hypothetical protein